MLQIDIWKVMPGSWLSQMNASKIPADILRDLTEEGNIRLEALPIQLLYHTHIAGFSR